jgi:single-strand DNA-binding protein
MAFVRVEQRNAHLASAVRLVSVQGRDGQPVSKATLTAISNTRKGSGDNRGEEATAILWTLWGKQADNAAQYLGKGSHVNVVGRVQNNNYDRDGETVYSMAFTAEEVDYLDTKAEGEALRGKQGPAPEEGDPVSALKPAAKAKGAKPVKGKKAAAPQAALAGVDAEDDIPF